MLRRKRHIVHRRGKSRLTATHLHHLSRQMVVTTMTRRTRTTTTMRKRMVIEATS
jgi:hypothetical protein